MGRVYTWQNLQEGNVPEMHAMDYVIRYMSRVLETMLPADRDLITGAVVCGSISRKDGWAMRADVDCFVLYRHQHEKTVFTHLQDVVLHAKLMHVPVSFIPCDTKLAETSFHHVGETFREHLQQSVDRGHLVFADPLDGLAPGAERYEEVSGYMRVKLYSLQEAHTKRTIFTPEEEVRYLQKMLEAPMHVARKMLAVFDCLEYDGKQAVLEQYEGFFPAKLAHSLQLLIALDDEYSAVLLQQVRRLGKPVDARELREIEREYRHILNKLLDASLLVQGFIRENLLHLSRYHPSNMPN